ncbi:MAG: hypothetical protein J6S14_13650 [Clostridia bacterium]|nr:hypothetical protein [Clostridia bacterium]
MTDILQVLTQYCDVYVDDDRMNDLKATDFPLWAFRMWAYLRAAIPQFNLPSEMPTYLVGDNGEFLSEPSFASYQVTVSNDQTVFVSSDYIGFDYCSARIVSVDQYGDVQYQQTQCAYDAESGSVTIDGVEDGAVVEFDFYKDGAFVHTLTPEIMSVLGLCFAYVWETRFINNWLSNVTKIEDQSFYEQNRANKERADSERLELLKYEMSSAMRRLDENNAFRKIVLGKKTGF